MSSLVAPLTAIVGIGYYVLSLMVRKSNESALETQGYSEPLETEVVPVQSAKQENDWKFFKHLEPQDAYVAKLYHTEQVTTPPVYINSGGKHGGIGIPVGGGTSNEWKSNRSFFGRTDLKPHPTMVDEIELAEKWTLYAHGPRLDDMCHDIGIDMRDISHTMFKVGYSNIPSGLAFAFRNRIDKARVYSFYVGDTKAAAIQKYCFSKRLPLSITALVVGTCAAGMCAVSMYNSHEDERRLRRATRDW